MVLWVSPAAHSRLWLLQGGAIKSQVFDSTIPTITVKDCTFTGNTLDTGPDQTVSALPPPTPRSRKSSLRRCTRTSPRVRVVGHYRRQGGSAYSTGQRVGGHKVAPEGGRDLDAEAACLCAARRTLVRAVLLGAAAANSVFLAVALVSRVAHARSPRPPLRRCST